MSEILLELKVIIS